MLPVGPGYYIANLVIVMTSAKYFPPNNNEPVVLKNTQVLRYLLCYSSVLGVDVLVQNTRGQKGVITYNKAHGMTAMKKHVEHEHQEVLSRYYREVLECRLILPSLASKKRNRVSQVPYLLL